MEQKAIKLAKFAFSFLFALFLFLCSGSFIRANELPLSQGKGIPRSGFPERKPHFERQVSVNLVGKTLGEALEYFRAEEGLYIDYRTGDVSDIKLDLHLVNIRLDRALDTIFSGTGLEWQFSEGRRNAGGNPGGNAQALAANSPANPNDDYVFAQVYVNNDRQDGERLELGIDARYRLERERQPRARRHSPSQGQRAAGLAGLIQNTIEPDTWRPREVEDPEEPDDATVDIEEPFAPPDDLWW